MEVARDFLENSTIHGLLHISRTRRLVRLIWVGIVMAGFSVAASLIQQSFSSWASSPITTTIETRPISDLDFPNVTVCPPRNSFTSLNPDLLRSRNLTFDKGNFHLNQTSRSLFCDKLVALSSGIMMETHVLHRFVLMLNQRASSDGVYFNERILKGETKRAF